MSIRPGDTAAIRLPSIRTSPSNGTSVSDPVQVSTRPFRNNVRSANVSAPLINGCSIGKCIQATRSRILGQPSCALS